MSDVTLLGNLTRDPELRYTPAGVATATIGLAVNRSWNDKTTGERQEAVSFFNVVLWGDLAENAAESLSKGTRCLVAGRLEQRSWEDDEGGKRSVVEIVASGIGPDLRWATAQVVRNERVTPSDDEEEAPPAPTGRRRSAPLKAAS